MENRIKAVIFDVDGVLVDSEDVMARAGVRALAEFGIRASPDDFLPFRGRGDELYMGGVARLHGSHYDVRMKERAYAIFKEMADEVFVFPCAAPLIKALRTAGFKLAVASGADSGKVEVNLSCLGFSPADFDAVVTGSNGLPPKPEPDIFLFAAGELGLSPDKCLVAEDALSGVSAGRAAGMTVAAVTTSFEEAALIAAGADHVICDLFEILALAKGEKA